MRILHIIPNLSGGGAERQLSYLAPELARMGHDVHIAYSKEGPHKPELPGVVLHQLKSESNYDPYLFVHMVKIIRCIKPDIVHTWILQMDILGGITANLSRIPWIFREASSAMGYSPTFKNRLRVRVGSLASAIVSNSQGGDQYWETQLPCSPRFIIPNGLPLLEIEKTVATLPPGLKDSKTPIVIFVGRMVVSKNLKSFLEVLACIKKQKYVYGILCGDGPQRSSMEILRHKLGLDADVHFTGQLSVSSVWALMKKASVFVSLSRYEGCPNSVMEAMACSCPLVLSDIPAHREILDERCVLFVDTSNIQQTAEAIVKTLQNVDASKARALIAKQKTKEWTVNIMAHNWERVYKEVKLVGRNR